MSHMCRHCLDDRENLQVEIEHGSGQYSCNGQVEAFRDRTQETESCYKKDAGILLEFQNRPQHNRKSRPPLEGYPLCHSISINTAKWSNVLQVNFVVFKNEASSSSLACQSTPGLRTNACTSKNQTNSSLGVLFNSHNRNQTRTCLFNFWNPNNQVLSSPTLHLSFPFCKRVIENEYSCKGRGQTRQA